MEPLSLDDKYDATRVEPRRYQIWESEGAFQAQPDSDKPVFCITIPPPNITGSLHMGHALCYPIQDLMGRYKKLRGYDVLILPGQDHAGIATQSVVLKQLKKEGVALKDVSREQFIERAWKWRDESGDTILHQFRALGCGFDWTRQRFTLDENYVKAVYKVFINWFDRGLIYKGLRVVNWDPILKTSVSDIETERKNVKGKLYHIRYPFTDGSGHVEIATTRPETMLADVAVAVHPKDTRYTGLVGKTLTLPLVGRDIPLIADHYPDPEFGTGAVKITPGHDANDFEVGERHNLEVLVVMNEDATMNDLAGEFAGLDRLEARKRVVAALEEQGFLVDIKDHEIPLIVSERSGEPIEPMAREEWFARQGDLAKRAAQAVKDGRIEFIPARFADEMVLWLENIRDWNFSRKLWWGHRIPIFYTESGEAVAALSHEEAEQKCGQPIVSQDERVLDTWFSSGLWPFATLGWPEETPDLAKYYPTSLLVTSKEINYLWVARMMMMGLDFMNEIPFHKVFVYATVLNEEGKRMSKSLGTGVDPLEIIDTRGADALRYTLMAQTGYNQDIRYSERKTVDAGHMCNKIWNAARFINMNLEGFTGAKPTEFAIEDKWILSRLHHTIAGVEKAYEDCYLQEAAQVLYTFFWSEFADWYIEVSKSRLQNPEQRATPQWVLMHCFENFLKMMHPIMPFITDELYQLMPFQNKARFIGESSWPSIMDNPAFPVEEAKLSSWIESVRAVRALRAEFGLAALKQVPKLFAEGEISEIGPFLCSQAWFGAVEQGTPAEMHVSTSINGYDFHLPLAGIVDPTEEVKRLADERAKLAAEHTSLSGRLSNPQFVERAKPEVVQRDQARVEELAELLQKNEQRAAMFSKL